MSYGIEVGQIYIRADGIEGYELLVVDTETYKHVEDVVVYDNYLKTERLIDSFKLARVRYKLKK